MTTKSLACLVLAVVLGTAMSVRWYLDAEEAVHAAPPLAVRPVVYQHLPLPMRAEPARSLRVGGDLPAAEGSYELSAPPSVGVPLVQRPCAGAAEPTAADPSAFGTGASAF
jgi:hypothetical protein